MFGKQFSDHMLTIEWSQKDGWEAPRIKPFQNLSLHPASSALHYSIEVGGLWRDGGGVSSGGERRSYSTVFVALQLFEGMKAFRGVDNHVRLFRPMLNMERMHRSADRSCLPVSPRPQDRSGHPVHSVNTVPWKGVWDKSDHMIT